MISNRDFFPGSFHLYDADVSWLMLACVLLVTFYSNFSCLLGLNQSKIKACCDINHVLYLTDVTVKTAILKSAVQTKYNTISAVIAGDVSSIDPKNVVVTNTATKAVVAVKRVAKDPKDSTKTLITTFGSMTDGKDYTVAYDGTEVSFTATDAVVADVAVDPTTITAGSVGTKIYAQLLDKNGIVTEEWVYADPNTPGKIEFTINSNKGYTSGDTLVLPEVGDTATAKVIYHTYQYDTTGAETGKLEKEVTITAVEDATTLSNYNYTISDKAAVNWNAAVAKNTSFAIGDAVNVFFYFKDSADNDVTKNYTVESSDTSVLLLDNTTLNPTGNVYKGSDGIALTGIKAGTAYINVKNGAGKVVTSLPVTVKEERQLKSIKLGTNNVTFSASTGESNYAADVSVDGFDQYGDRYPVALGLTTKILSAPTGAGSPWGKGEAGDFGAVTSNEYGHTTIDFTLARKVGTYQVEVTVADRDRAWNTVKTVLTINGVRTDNVTTPTYGIIVNNSSVDIAVDSYATSVNYRPLAVTARVVEYKNGAITNTGLTADYTVLKPNKTQLSTTTNSAIGCTTALTTLADSVVTKNIPSWELGTYTVIGEYTPARGAKKTFTTSFTVKDSQDSAFADVKKTSDSTMPVVGDKYANAKTILCNRDLVEIYYDGAPLTLEAADFAGVVADGGNKDAVKLNGKLLYIGTVNVKVSTVGRLEVVVPVTINRTFTLN